MNKKLMILFLGIILVGTVVGGIGLSNRDKTIIYEKNITDALETKGIETWDIEDYEDSDKMKRCLISNTGFNLPCSPLMKTYRISCTEFNQETEECDVEVRIDFTEEQKKTILDNWEHDRMEGIGNVINQRSSIEILNKTAEGTTTPTNK